MIVKVKHENVPFNYWNIDLKSQGVLQVNNLDQRGSANKKSLKTPALEEALLWIDILSRIDSLKLKHLNDGFIS